MPFTCETMREKSGPKVFVRYRENSLYGNSFYGASTVVSSGKGQQKNWSIDFSSCKYGVYFSIGCVSSSSSPSSNKPVFCPHCENKFILWSDNLQCHYDQKHPTSIAPEIDIEEIERLRKFKK